MISCVWFVTGMSLDEGIGLGGFLERFKERMDIPSREPWKDIPPWGKRKIIIRAFLGDMLAEGNLSTG